ncbi:MAG TPA: hypothetical protein VJ840_18335, partial [Gemmatimonadaceae bacterium]|nr:hypothetical protein [Gemmatimonadaceae bacterium]
VIDFSFELSTDYSLQQLRRAVEPVRTRQGWQRRSADSIAAYYLDYTSSIYKLLIEQSDSLFLTKAQVASLTRADSIYSERVRAIYVPLGQFLARNNGEAGKAELDSANASDKLYWKVFWEQPDTVAQVLTPTQRELMPMVKAMIEVPKNQREHTQFNFGYSVTLAYKPKASQP